VNGNVYSDLVFLDSLDRDRPEINQFAFDLHVHRQLHFEIIRDVVLRNRHDQLGLSRSRVLQFAGEIIGWDGRAIYPLVKEPASAGRLPPLPILARSGNRPGRIVYDCFHMRRVLFLILLTGVSGAMIPVARPLRFKITLDRQTAPNGAAGRLFVFMSEAADKRSILSSGFLPDRTYLASMEVDFIAPGSVVDFDPDIRAYPKALSQIKAGNYRFMALLDQDHSMVYNGEDGDDLYSAVISVQDLDPGETAPLELKIDRRMKGPYSFADTENVKLAEFQSPLLSSFWGRPISMKAGVVLPPETGKGSGGSFPAVYHVHGFGGNYTGAWSEGPALVNEMKQGKRSRMVHVFLNGAFPSGHHGFADSVNNGPWGTALTREFIPWLEKKYPIIAKPSARFLTGHSSGGWSTLWLQIRYPDYFGGAWSTSPDPVDFRSFTGFDATPGSKDNVYLLPDGTERSLVVRKERAEVSIEQFVKHEMVQGEYGGQFSSFEWVFSPKDQDGRPMKLFNRSTGVLDPDVLDAWRKYDIGFTLRQNWDVLAPMLRGKIHIFCGGQDTFQLEKSTSLLCEFLKSKGSDAVCEIVPGRDHFDLYESYKTFPQGLEARIDSEMNAIYKTKAYNLTR
jgi:S-formylglutathione hydrolase FrmB